MKNICLEIVSNILSCFEEHYKSTYTENSDEITSHGDHLLFDICLVLNTCVWPDAHENKSESKRFSLQLSSIQRLYDQFCTIVSLMAFLQMN